MPRKLFISCVVGLAASAACASLFAGAEEAAPPTPPGHDHDMGRVTASSGGAPTTRPGGWRGPGGGPGGPGNDGRPPAYGRRGPGDGWRDQTAPSTEEWSEIEAFMRENSPVRLSMYQKIENEFGVDRTQMLRRRIAARYRDLNSMKDRNADLYEFASKQLHLEDKVLGTMAQIRREGDSPKLQAALNEQMLGFIQNSLDERAARLARVKEFVAKEEAGLERDRANTGELVAKQRERFDKEMSRMLDFADRADDKGDDKGPATKPASDK